MKGIYLNDVMTNYFDSIHSPFNVTSSPQTESLDMFFMYMDDFQLLFSVQIAPSSFSFPFIVKNRRVPIEIKSH